MRSVHSTFDFQSVGMRFCSLKREVDVQVHTHVKVTFHDVLEKTCHNNPLETTCNSRPGSSCSRPSSPSQQYPSSSPPCRTVHPAALIELIFCSFYNRVQANDLARRDPRHRPCSVHPPMRLSSLQKLRPLMAFFFFFGLFFATLSVERASP